MNSVFSFRRTPNTGSTTPTPPGTPPEAGSANLAVRAASGSRSDSSTALSISIEGTALTPGINLKPFVESLLVLLKAYLPVNGSELPSNGLGLVGLKHRALGLGGFRGIQTSQGFDMAEIHGGLLEGILRFELWANDPDQLGNMTMNLQTRLLSDGLVLRQAGLLKFQQVTAADSSADTNPVQWRKSLEYGFLYEYRYVDSSSAAGLIARVPIHSDVDGLPGSGGLSTEQDWMTLWDSTGAPMLVISADSTRDLVIRGLLVAIYLANGGPSGQVILEQGSTVSITYPSLTGLLADCIPAGDLDLVYPPKPLQPAEVQVIHPFQVGELRFSSPILLKGGGEPLQVRFEHPSFPQDDLSQVYIRALPGP
jgi:hypothetical protein